MRAAAIWITGLLASGIVGAATLMALFWSGHGPEGFFPFVFGVIGGMCIFVCIRLWIREPPPTPRPEQPHQDTIADWPDLIRRRDPP